MFKIVLAVSSALVLAAALPQPPSGSSPNSIEPSLETAARSMKKDCSSGIFSSTCLKIEAISVLEKLSAKEELNLLPGVSVVKEAVGDNGSQAEQVAAELARSLPGKPEERLDKYLLYRLGTYLDTHSVKLRLLDSSAAEEARSAIGEARKQGGLGGGGGGGKKGGMGGLMAAALMMKVSDAKYNFGDDNIRFNIESCKLTECRRCDIPTREHAKKCKKRNGTLMSIGLGGLAMLAGKALMTAMMSLLLSAVIGLKSLTSGGGKSTTYEIVSKPIYSHSHSHSTGHEDVGYGGHSGYGRAIDAKVRRR